MRETTQCDTICSFSLVLTVVAGLFWISLSLIYGQRVFLETSVSLVPLHRRLNEACSGNFTTCLVVNQNWWLIMSGAKWCCHPTRHAGARRMGPEGTDKHRKGKYRLSFELASHISNVYSTADSARMIYVASDLLCTTCFNVEMSGMNPDTSANRMETDDNQYSKMRAAMRSPPVLEYRTKFK